MLLFGWIIYNGSNPNHWMQNENWNHNKINQKKSFKLFHFQFLASFNNFASFARLRCCFQAFVKHLSQTDTVLGLPSIITVERNENFYFFEKFENCAKIKKKSHSSLFFEYIPNRKYHHKHDNVFSNVTLKIFLYN